MKCISQQSQFVFNSAMSEFVSTVEAARDLTMSALLSIGAGDRRSAAPYVKGWAKAEGMSERTAYRWLAKLFPNEAGQRGPKRGSGQTDPVEALVKKFEKLSASQQRRFLAAVK